jgi:hypothetical protein
LLADQALGLVLRETIPFRNIHVLVDVLFS